MNTTPDDKLRFPSGVDDPRIEKWLARSTRRKGFVRPNQPSLAQRLRFWSWGMRRGLQLYFFNHILNRIPSHALRLAVYRRYFDIGAQSSVLLGLHLYDTKRLIIGHNSTISQQCVFDNRAGIRIGNNVSIGPYVQIWSGGHDINDPQFTSTGGVIVIDDYTFIAAGAIIVSPMGGRTLTIGEGAVVAPGAVVVRDVPPYAVMAGNPARKLAQRATDLQYTLNFFPPFQ
jgi:acetyltransferase-like isoleucine patch superfamily enzyme